MKLVTYNGLFSGYICSCGRHNDILNFICWSCGVKSTIDQDIRFRVTLIRDGWEYRNGRLLTRMPVTDKDIELHSKFFNHELGIVVDMSIEDIVRHIEELEMICFEAKARIGAAKLNQKERLAKLSKAEREKLISSGEFSMEESDSLIRKRVERVSKADKTIDSLKALGLSDDIIKTMMGNVKVDESKSRTVSNKLDNRRDTSTFNAPAVVLETKKSLDTQKALLDSLSTSVVKGLNELVNPFADSPPRPIEDIAKAAVTAAHIAKKVDPSLVDVDVNNEITPTDNIKPFWEV